MREEKVFNVGDKVIHPSYGAGTILEINEKQVGEQQCTYYIIDLLTQAGTLMVPVSRADELGLRQDIHDRTRLLEIGNGHTESRHTWTRSIDDLIAVLDSFDHRIVHVVLDVGEILFLDLPLGFGFDVEEDLHGIDNEF